MRLGKCSARSVRVSENEKTSFSCDAGYAAGNFPATISHSLKPQMRKILNIEIAVKGFHGLYFASKNVQEQVLPRAWLMQKEEDILYRFPKYLHHKTKDLREIIDESREQS